MRAKLDNPTVAERVVIRVVKTPQSQRGEILALFVHSRMPDDASGVVYSLTRQQFRVEPYRKIMWRTTRATLQQVDWARDQLHYAHLHVTILQGAPALRVTRPAYDPSASLEEWAADEAPARHPDTKKDS
jgi:hypothetical protein